MGGFSVAQYEAAVNKVTKGGETLSQKVAGLPPHANNALSKWWIPGYIKEAIKWMVEKACAIGKWILDKIVELLKGAVAPIRMFFDAWKWQDVREISSGVAGVLKDTNLTVDDEWRGSARDAYVKAMTAQNLAATRVGAVADKAAVCLTVVAAAGMVFYVALGVIVVKMIATFISAFAVIATGVFSWAGASMIVADAGVTSAMIWAAIAALSALLTAQAGQMVVMHGEAKDGNFFPNGKWPTSQKGTYDDGSHRDGDAPGWSQKK